VDPTSTVRTDALPAVATLVIPGALAAIPYAWLLLGTVDSLRAYLASHDGVATLIAIVVSLATGFLVESLGSFVEVLLIDKRRPNHEQHLESWWRYLRIAWVREPIGQRYLRRLLVTFKFELNMFVATCFLVPGFILLGLLGSVGCVIGSSVAFGALLSALIFYFLACTSSDVLSNVRTNLLKGVGEPPFNGPDESVGPPSA